MIRIALLNSGGGWHLQRLREAFIGRGAEADAVPIARLVGSVGARATPPVGAQPSSLAGSPQVGASGAPHTDAAGIPLELTAAGQPLEKYDAIVVRVIPLGSLEQIVYRMDALHLLDGAGVPIFNPPRAIERTVDKFWTSALLDGAGIPTPRTAAAESFEDALAAFHALGGDVVVKPLFGSGGRGIFRLTDEEMAYRAFRTIELHRWVYYLQRFVDHGTEDMRVFVIGSRAIAACRRIGVDWRSNVGRGATTRSCALSPAQEELALRACRAVGAEYAGVDLAEGRDGRTWVLEVNSIPGWSGLQEATSIDIASEIAAHVLARCSEAGRAAARVRSPVRGPAHTSDSGPARTRCPPC